jgi:hypothetical protein
MELESRQKRLSESLLHGKTSDDVAVQVSEKPSVTETDTSFRILVFCLRILVLDERSLSTSLLVCVKWVLRVILLCISSLGAPYFWYLQLLGTVGPIASTVPYSVRFSSGLHICI